MNARILITVTLLLIILLSAAQLDAQQKGQYIPGQVGLNAGIVPDPGFMYENLALSYSADQLNNQLGSAFRNVTGNYGIWVDENIFMFVPKHTFLSGYYAPYAIVSWPAVRSSRTFRF